MTPLRVYMQPSSRSEKKYMVVFERNGRPTTVHFGATGYSDFTLHKDEERRRRYDQRHRRRETWTKEGIGTPGFWAKWILWSKPTLGSAVRHAEDKFNLRIIVKRKRKAS